MRGYVQMISRGKVSEKPEIWTLGGFGVDLINGDRINFDWNESYSGAEFDNGHLVMDCELRDFAYDVFGDEYLELGFTHEQICGALLASGLLDEVYYECFADQEEEQFIFMDLVSFTIDDGGKEYSFTAEQIAELNARIRQDDAEQLERESNPA